MGRGRRRKTQPTYEWQELLPLFEWPRASMALQGSLFSFLEAL
jgi:hypothetical protein